MKRVIFWTFLLLLLGKGVSNAQTSADLQVTVEVDPDTILMANVFYVTYNLEGAEGDFTPPAFDHFEILSQNSGSSISIINGQTKRTSTYTFALKPKEPGTYTIDPAVITLSDGSSTETTPLDITVYPNPDGRQISPRRQKQMGIFGHNFFQDKGSIWDSFEDDFFGFGNKQKPKSIKKPIKPRKKRYKF